MTKEWKWIRGYEGIYKISSAGEITSHKWNKVKKLKPYHVGVDRRLVICLCRDGKVTKHLIHRLLVDTFINEIPEGMVVDHINGIPLDNRLENLRICTRAQNSLNIGKASGNFSSQYKGVSWDKRRSKWQAGIAYKRKHYRLGGHETEALAAMAYNEKAKVLFGEFARINLIKET